MKILEEKAKAACADCVSYDMPRGQCRRTLPTATGWPAVNGGDWCGEFTPNPPASKAGPKITDEDWRVHAKYLEKRLERALNQRDEVRALLRPARQAVAYVVTNTLSEAAMKLLGQIDDALKSHTAPVRD